VIDAAVAAAELQALHLHDGNGNTTVCNHALPLLLFFFPSGPTCLLAPTWLVIGLATLVHHGDTDDDEGFPYVGTSAASGFE
jgi:hypothetical protein